jgi:hypothetical protein
VPGGTVTGTLTAPVPVFLIVTTPFCSEAVTVPAVWAAAQADCWPRTWASETSVIWVRGVALVYQVSYWDNMLLMSANRV